jgi:hypothetical protein
MQSHAATIQAILARELDEQVRRQVQLVPTNLLPIAPSSSGIAAIGPEPQVSRYAALTTRRADPASATA